MPGYPSDLTDSEWAQIAGFFERPDPRGNRGKYEKRDVVNAILYVVKGGIPWRMLPLDFPPWDTVYDHYRRWNQRGVGTSPGCAECARGTSRANTSLRPMSWWTRNRLRPNMPVKIEAPMGEKKIKGRKRPLATDTLGNMLTIQVHAANGADTSRGWEVCDHVAEK